MHASEREGLIIDVIAVNGFVTYRALEERLPASPATIRRDLSRLEGQGRIVRVRGGAKLAESANATAAAPYSFALSGLPFNESLKRNLVQKRAIGRAAALLCRAGEGIMIDGGTTTFQMCPHLDGLNLQVLTNSLHIVSALLAQTDTRILVPAGAVFREQNIILAPAGDDSMPRFHAPKLFMGAAAIGRQGVMQADVVLVSAERRLIDRAEEVIVCVDSSKFGSSSGNVVCELQEIDIVVTDEAVSEAAVAELEEAGISVVIAVAKA